MAKSSSHTHYDNLKVSRDAPPEVIRAAYRSLSQKYHPDRNPGDENAARIMQVINLAYEVLSDPKRRKLHDEWIRSQEEGVGKSIRTDDDNQQMRPAPSAAAAYPRSARRGSVSDKSPSGFVFRNFPLVAGVSIVAVLALLIVLSETVLKPRSVISNIERAALAPPPMIEHPQPAPAIELVKVEFDPFAQKSKPHSQKRSFQDAPNGLPWPSKAGYVSGFPIEQTGGLSTVTVDNSQNSMAVYVKLISLKGSKRRAVRHVFIPAHDAFEMTDVATGVFDIRFQDLSSGARAKSEPFVLSEVQESDGIRFSKYRLTLYRVSQGNTRMTPISEDEFQ